VDDVKALAGTYAVGVVSGIVFTVLLPLWLIVFLGAVATGGTAIAISRRHDRELGP
jgi:hypothetical protein